MRIYFFFIFILLSCCSSKAISAYPYPIPITINGNVSYIKLYGDEQHKWAETPDGYTIIQNERNQWCYASVNSSGHLIATDYLFGTRNSGNNGFREFLSSTPVHLKSKVFSQAKHSGTFRIAKATGERRVLVILMAFADVKFTKTVSEFEKLFNQKEYDEDGAQGSVKDFYLSSSYGQLELTSDLYGPYTASHDMGFYGNNDISGSDINPYNLFLEAIEQVANETDLRLYDGDGDGYLDNVHIIYAGYGEEAGAPASTIWAHESTFRTPYEIQGIKIDRYSCAPELRENSGSGISRIGPHCHEIGHALGAMDYYDTNYNGDGRFLGTGNWDVMAQGSWNNGGVTPADFNPYVKAYDFGWITLRTLPTGKVVVKPSNRNSECYYLLGSSEASDYYILENRSKEDWGAQLPGYGLLLYHIHQDIRNSGNNINSTAPQKCYLVCASSKVKIPSEAPSSYGDINTEGCPFPGSANNRRFGVNTTPAAFYWSSEVCAIDIEEISMLTNGDISLVNASEGAGYQPKIPQNLFFEGFEDSPQYKLISSGKGEWEVVDNPVDDNIFVSRPVSYAGIKSLQLSAAREYFDDKESCIEFEIESSISNGERVLSGYYTASGLSRKASNSLRVGYMSKEGEWVFHEYRASSNIIWNPFVIDVPSDAIMRFRIEGQAKMGTILAIDNIKVDIMVSTLLPGRTVFSSKIGRGNQIYDINGLLRDSLGKGLNIIRQKDGTVKKVFVK